MTTNEQLIAQAFNRHTQEHHNSDYEVCRDPLCETAYALEQAGGENRAAFKRAAQAMREAAAATAADFSTPDYRDGWQDMERAGPLIARDIRALPLLEYTPE